MNIEALIELKRVMLEVKQRGEPVIMQSLTTIKNSNGDWGGQSFPEENVPRLREECGFAACAIGWCAFDLWFMERGFGLKDHKFGSDISYAFVHHEGRVSFDQIAEFFNLKENDRDYIFISEYYPGSEDGKGRPVPVDPLRVVEHIDKVLHDRGF